MRVAVIVCGQMRCMETAVETWNEYLFSVYPDADVFVSTQDVDAVKGRIYVFPTVANQYVFQPVTYDIQEKLTRLLGSRLKKTLVRRGMYHYYVSNQRADFVLGNSLGWAENFRDMQIALEMAGRDYDLYIKIRPDICLCKPFYAVPDPVPKNTIYVADRQRGFLWDAVFAMDRAMADRMLGFYDYYRSLSIEGVASSFDAWNNRLNAEEKLLEFATINNADIVDMKKVGYPLTWLIGDIKNNLHRSLRHLDFSYAWRKRLEKIAERKVSSRFDVCCANCKYDPLPKYVADTSKPKAALLVCGMMRHARFCLPSIVENVAAHYDCDVYVATQDCVTLRPREEESDRRLVSRVPSMEEEYREVFGSALKGYHVRYVYDHMIANQRKDLTLLERSAWRGDCADLSKAFEMAISSGVRYDVFIRVRPDSILAQPLAIQYCPIDRNAYFARFSASDCECDVFAVDRQLAERLARFNDWYRDLAIEHQERPGMRLREFLSRAGARMIRIRNESISLEDMIRDLRIAAAQPRHRLLAPKWAKAVEKHAENFRQTIFDLSPDELEAK